MFFLTYINTLEFNNKMIFYNNEKKQEKTCEIYFFFSFGKFLIIAQHIKDENNFNFKIKKSMKNLFLGLFLAVGVSGFAFANGQKDESTQNNIKKDDKPLSCTTGVKVTMTMCDGSKEVTNLGSFETDCGANEDGSVIIRNIQLKEACD